MRIKTTKYTVATCILYSVDNPERIASHHIGREVGNLVERIMLDDPGADENMLLRISRAPTWGDAEQWYIEQVEIEET